ncbi:hypothetical protein [Aquiflexum sp.]|uniref:hypothetical protein n=1 Tax=Aquiflexum sp. TaxID=1872584 RepID=UPI003593739A
MKKFLLLSLFLILSFQYSCVKEEDLDPIEVGATIEALVNKIHQGFFEFEINGGTIDEPISLPTEGMDGIYGIRSADLDNLEGDDLSLFNCLNNLNPGIQQRLKLRSSSNTFAVCRYATGLAYKADITDLLDRVEVERLDYIRQFNEGEITQASLVQELTDLKERFSLFYLGIKEFYSDIFKTCLETLVVDIQIILNNQQWQTFVGCNKI